ncbi:MAG TPA: hypothetical protein VMN60_04145 [Longimicrobiales bacterium]|nr:hypothetical protein [Longimicrobiales bacterium]
MLQLFTKLAARWAEPELDQEQVAAYRPAAARHAIRAASAHDSYLINLATPDPVLHARSLASFQRERDDRFLSVPKLSRHPGMTLGSRRIAGIWPACEPIVTDSRTCVEL